MKRKLFPIVFMLLTAVLAACNTATTPAPTGVPATPLPATGVPATDEPTPVIAATQPLPTATETTSTVTETPAADPADPGNSPIFGIPWTDRSVFKAGLIDSQLALLDELPGAPVYHMQLTLSDDLTSLDGRQAVYYTNTEDVALNEVYFHLFPNLLEGAIEVSNVTVDGQPVLAEMQGTDDIVLRIPLPEPLAPGDSVVITMDFTTSIPTDIGRNYGIFAYADDVLALAHFYPMLAVYDEDGWAIEVPDTQGDVTYGDTAYYLVEVTAPADLQLVGGGIIVDSQTGDDRQTVTYAAGPMRDFYLAASDGYVVMSDTVNGVTVNSYGPAEYPDGVKLALDVAMATIAQHSEWLAPYPFSELDIVATATSALGVEYPGIIVNTARMYDIDAQTGSGVPWGVILESTTAHEVGHQWFYSLVGNDQLNEPWLDESLTQYATYHYYLERYGPRGAEAYLGNLQGRWDSVDGEEIPIGRPVEAYDGGEYGAIVYGRGPIFVRALADQMGLAAFDAFIRDYVLSNSLGIATTEGFRALAESHCNCDLQALFDAWVYE